MSITDPRDISGLRLWLSADAISGYADNAQITGVWADQSGNGFDGSPAATTKPKYRTTAGQGGGPAVEFPNDGYFTFGDVMASAAAGEMMMTVRHNTGNTGSWAFGASTGNSDEGHYPFSGTVFEAFGLASGNRQSFTPTLAIASWRRYNVWSAAGDWAALLDETSQATSAATSVGWTTVPFVGAGKKNSGVDLRFNGWIGCLVVYDRKLTTGERADLAAWLTANPSGGTPGGGSALTASATDSAGLVDNASTQSASGVIVTDSAGLTDSFSVSIVRGVTATDRAGLVDSVVPGTPNIAATDSVGLTDDFTAIIYTDTPTDNPTEDPPAFTDPPGATGTHDTTDTPPAVEDYPTDVPVPVITRSSSTWPAPVLDANGQPDRNQWLPTSTTEADMGRFQLVIDHVDRTVFRKAPVVIGRYTKNAPFGDNELELLLPQVTIFERPGVGELAWLKPGLGVEVHRRSSSGRKVRFEGLIPKMNAFERGLDGGLTVHVLGALYEADLQVHRPGFYYDELDVGTRVRMAFEECRSRHFVAPVQVATGIPSRKRGDMSQSPLRFIGELLSTATTADGTNQWTVRKDPGRRAVIALKDLTTVHWTVTAGVQGVELDLDEDWTAAPNVYYGEGQAPDGCTWRNAKYPHERPDDAPPYPFSSAGTVITIGDSGEGVRLWQIEMAANGYNLDADGYYGPEDAYQCRRLQHAAGILVDGIVGPQTWAATFEVGSNIGDLNGAYIAPLAYRTEVEPYLYNAQGAIIGNNPAYDPDVLRIEGYINFGDGTSKRDAVRDCLSRLHRFATPGLVGEITLYVDPEEGTRWDIDEGKNIRVRWLQGHGSNGVLFHIAGVDGSPEAGRVTLTVDTHARDLMMITAIRQRDREALSPAFDQLGNRSASSVRDTSLWDCENGAGIMPKHAIYGGLWTVNRIPGGRIGAIARTAFRTSSPHAIFALGVFSKPITANDLAAIVGNPLTGTKAWTTQYDALVPFGWLIAWGDKDQPAGYFPGLGSDDDPLTGRLEDDQHWNYKSDHPPWLWVAEYSPTSCFIEGRFYQEIVDL